MREKEENHLNFVGIDMGSTCSKLVALNEAKEIVYKEVVPTGWNCVETAETLLSHLEAQGIPKDAFRSVATGYGRVSIPFADKCITEISCHGKGAVAIFDEPDFTLIDIGGQDTKVIEIKGGSVKNFYMNDKCSAGTGRFLEIMAGTLGVDLNKLCELGRQSQNHVSISSMCTVFAESEVISLIGRGTDKADIAYGIVESIANKVKSQMGRVSSDPAHLRLSGGLCEVPFLLELLSEKLGGEVKTDPLARYAGAYGAALFASELK